MKDFYSVKELSEICSVSEQAIRAYLAQHNCAKVASKWKPTQDELRALFRHYGVDVAKLAQESQDTCATDESNATAVAQVAQDKETAGQAAILTAKVEQLEIRLKEKDSEIEFLRNELKDSREIQKQLAAQNTVYTTKYLVEASQESEQEPIIEVENDGLEVESNTNGIIEQTPIEETETQAPQKTYTFGQRLSFLFTGRLD